jgi:hypothetical protein
MNSQNGSTRSSEPVQVLLSAHPALPADWAVAWQTCPDCGQRTASVVVPDPNQPAPRELQAVVDILGLSL